MIATWATDVSIAYFAGIVFGSPAGIVATRVSGWAPAMTISIVGAMVAVLIVRRLGRHRTGGAVPAPSRSATAAAACLAILLGACSKSPTAPTPILATETLTGTVQVGGSDSKRFTVSYTGDVSDGSLTLNGLTSVATGAAVATTIGVGFGSLAFDGSCVRSATYTATAATLGQEMFASGAFGPGTYCVQVYDAGTLTEPLNYSLTLKHY
jgi:hypothetical protein